MSARWGRAANHSAAPLPWNPGSTVALEPDVAAIFDTPEAVNAALRFLIKVTRDNAPKETVMPFVTYENRRNPHATVHKAGCRQIAKNGGKHKYGQGGYKEHETFTDAQTYAQSTGLPVIYCSFCAPQGQALAGSAGPHAA